MMEFENYSEYKQHVSEMWKEGFLNELQFDELIKLETVQTEQVGNNLKYNYTEHYRLLTEEEFKEKFNK